MQGSVILKITLVVSALGAFPGAIAAAEPNPNLVKLECGNAPFPSCEQLTRELVSGNPNEPKMSNLNQITQNLRDGIYLGKLDQEEIGSAPFCPPLNLGFNGCKDESKTNVRDEACGDLKRIHRGADGKVVSPFAHVSGSRETANVMGSILVILADQSENLRVQMASNSLTIPSGSGCAPLVQDLKKLIDGQRRAVNTSKLASCDPKQLNECAAYQSFKATSESIRAAYMLLGRCVLVENVAREFRQLKSTVFADIKRNTMDVCASSPDANSLNQCYANKYDQWFKSMLRTRYPAAQTGC